MFEGDDFVVGVGVGFDVEFGDEFVEECELVWVIEEDDLVGVIVGVVGGGGVD